MDSIKAVRMSSQTMKQRLPGHQIILTYTAAIAGRHSFTSALSFRLGEGCFLSVDPPALWGSEAQTSPLSTIQTGLFSQLISKSEKNKRKNTIKLLFFHQLGLLGSTKTLPQNQISKARTSAQPQNLHFLQRTMFFFTDHLSKLTVNQQCFIGLFHATPLLMVHVVTLLHVTSEAPWHAENQWCLKFRVTSLILGRAR